MRRGKKIRRRLRAEKSYIAPSPPLYVDFYGSYAGQRSAHII